MHGQASLALVLVVSLLLGLRHASDPDHLAAVTTLIASEGQGQLKMAARMGLLWGAGHATTLITIGLPLVLLGHYLPEMVVRSAEVAIGALIVFLAIRLLLRWRLGLFHAHHHTHGDGIHRHLHSHSEKLSHIHTYSHAARLLQRGTSPWGWRLRRPYVAFAFDYPWRSGISCGTISLRNRHRRFDGAAIYCLWSSDSWRSDQAQIRTGSACVGSFGHSFWSVVCARCSENHRVPILATMVRLGTRTHIILTESKGESL